MDQPTKKSMNKLEAARMMIQWAIKLTQFNIKYHPRLAIKVQTLADFIVEFTVLDKDGALDEAERWTIQTNRSLTQNRGGVMIIIISFEGEMLKYRV